MECSLLEAVWLMDQNTSFDWLTEGKLGSRFHGGRWNKLEKCCFYHAIHKTVVSARLHLESTPLISRRQADRGSLAIGTTDFLWKVCWTWKFGPQNITQISTKCSAICKHWNACKKLDASTQFSTQISNEFSLPEITYCRSNIIDLNPLIRKYLTVWLMLISST